MLDMSVEESGTVRRTDHYQFFILFGSMKWKNTALESIQEPHGMPLLASSFVPGDLRQV